MDKHNSAWYRWTVSQRSKEKQAEGCAGEAMNSALNNCEVPLDLQNVLFKEARMHYVLIEAEDATWINFQLFCQLFCQLCHTSVIAMPYFLTHPLLLLYHFCPQLPSIPSYLSYLKYICAPDQLRLTFLWQQPKGLPWGTRMAGFSTSNPFDWSSFTDCTCMSWRQLFKGLLNIPSICSPALVPINIVRY